MTWSFKIVIAVIRPEGADSLAVTRPTVVEVDELVRALEPLLRCDPACNRPGAAVSVPSH